MLIGRFNQVQSPRPLSLCFIVRADTWPDLQVSNWVASQVVQSKEGHAAQRISHFIAIAKRLFEINNYNTLMEILSGLNNANISRLRATWAVRIPSMID